MAEKSSPDISPKYTLSTRGNKLIAVGEFAFRKTKVSNGISYWICTQYDKSKCRCSIKVIDGSDPPDVQEKSQEHNHCASFGTVEDKEMLQNISFVTQDDSDVKQPQSSIPTIFEQHDSMSHSTANNDNEIGPREKTDISRGSSGGIRKRKRISKKETETDNFMLEIQSLSAPTPTTSTNSARSIPTWQPTIANAENADRECQVDADELFLRSLLPDIRPMPEARKLRLKADMLNLVTDDHSDSDELFLRSLLPDLRAMPENRKLQFKIKVLNSLSEMTAD